MQHKWQFILICSTLQVLLWKCIRCRRQCFYFFNDISKYFSQEFNLNNWERFILTLKWLLFKLCGTRFIRVVSIYHWERLELPRICCTADRIMGIYTNDPNFLTVYLIVLTFKYIWNQISLPSLLNYTISFPQRILCETVKDIVAKVEKAFEKTLEKAVVADAVASKVSETCSAHGSFLLTILTLNCVSQLNGLGGFPAKMSLIKRKITFELALRVWKTYYSILWLPFNV